MATHAQKERDELQEAVWEGFEYYDLETEEFVADPTPERKKKCKYIPYILEFCSFSTH